MWHYWQDLEDIKLLATLLDPRLKSMNAWPNTLQTKTIGKLWDEFQIWKETTIADEPEIHHEETTAPSFIRKIFSSSSQEVNENQRLTTI